VKIAASAGEVHVARLGTGDARLLIGCDLVVCASGDALDKMNAQDTRAVVNATTSPTADFVKNPNWLLPGSDLTHDIREACGAGHADFVPAAELATALMGDSIATNMFMLGYAWQKGWVPLGREAIERAIELNGVAVAFNQQSFVWGRRSAVDLERVRRIAIPAEVITIGQHISRNLDELVERRVKLLADYQDEKYAEKYRLLVEKVLSTEKEKANSSKLAEAVARYYAKLLAYKDEYEVGRLHADPAFRKKIEGMFEGDYRVVYHLAPPLLARQDPITGEPRKMRFGGWVMNLFGILSRLKGLRGTAFDIFGYTDERRTERALIGEYERSVEALLAGLTRDNHALAVEIASLPEEIRGYGHIKMKSVVTARQKRDKLLAQFGSEREQRAAA